MVHIFHFLQTGMVFENVNPFSLIFNAISSEKSCLISKPFLTCFLDVRTPDFFSRLLNPDWSIQISRAPAVCKEREDPGKEVAKESGYDTNLRHSQKSLRTLFQNAHVKSLGGRLSTEI